MRFLILLLFLALNVSAQPLSVTHTFSNNTVADAAAINQNFADIVNGVNAKLKTDNAGPYNTAVGFEALSSNTGGSSNTASGYWALYGNTTGYSNTAHGFAALLSNTTGNYNTASGFRALYNTGDLAQRDRTSVSLQHHDVANIFCRLDATQSADQVFIGPLFIEVTTSRILIAAGQCRFDLGQRKAVFKQQVRIHQDLKLFALATHHKNLGNSRHGEELLTNNPVANRSQVHR